MAKKKSNVTPPTKRSNKKDTNNVTPSTEKIVEKENHKLNLVGSESVNDFLNSFYQNKLGSCLKALESNEIIIVDKAFLERKKLELDRYKSNESVMKEVISDAHKDITVMMETSMKINEIYAPIEKAVEPIFAKMNLKEGEEMGLGKWMKLLSKLAPVLYKSQKLIRETMSKIDIKAIQDIYHKYSSSHQSADKTNMRKLDEPTENLQLSTPNPPVDDASSVGESTTK